jgi:anti-sigma B factor antagonist
MKSTVGQKTIAIIEPQGNISAVNAETFQAQLMSALTDRANSLLLIDLKWVEFLDSAGLLALISVYRLARSLNRHVSLCSVAPSVRIIFELTQLDGVFEIFESRDACIAGVRSQEWNAC